MTVVVSLTVRTRREELDRIFAAVEDVARRDSWSQDVVFSVNLAIEEIGINIMDYAFHGGLSEFEVHLASDPDSVTVVITDAGPAFDPLTQAPGPDLDSALENRPIGGLGVHLVRNLMDLSVYQRVNGKNQLTLTKYRVVDPERAR